jgi:ribosome-associated heat shock protein Hsp15
MAKVRLDKWLWAARFYKTRAKSREAIDGGKVHVNGQRVKAGKDLRLEDELSIRVGWDEKTVHVKALADQRRGAPEAQLLYEETAESIVKRELEAEQRRAAGQHVGSMHRPSKKDRRLIHKFRENNQS